MTRPHHVPVIVKRTYLKMMISALPLACSCFPPLFPFPYTPYVSFSPPSPLHLLTSPPPLHNFTYLPPPTIYMYLLLSFSLPPSLPLSLSLPPPSLSPLLTYAIHNAGDQELPGAQDGWEYGKGWNSDAVSLTSKGAAWASGF